MRAVVQRVSSAAVTIDQVVTASIGPGLLVLLGVEDSDTPADADWLAPKIAQLRIFEDADGRMNRSVIEAVPAPASDPAKDSNGSAAACVLVVSQFTLLASTRKGTRPSFNAAAKPDVAIPLYEYFVRQMEALIGRPVATGTFGAMMQVSLVNDGPVTLVIDSRQRE
jgi:D-tyrosyl-tRNA(Tyr) deacylase